MFLFYRNKKVFGYEYTEIVPFGPSGRPDRPSFNLKYPQYCDQTVIWTLVLEPGFFDGNTRKLLRILHATFLMFVKSNFEIFESPESKSEEAP